LSQSRVILISTWLITMTIGVNAPAGEFRDVCHPYRGISFVEKASLQGPAQSYSNGVIEFNPRRLNIFTEHVQDFIMLHEAGHIHLKHGATISSDDHEGMKKAELAADKWAAQAWSLRWTDHELIEDIFKDLKKDKESERHPSGIRRIQQIKETLDSKNKNCPKTRNPN
jgi:hypothetical protein